MDIPNKSDATMTRNPDVSWNEIWKKQTKNNLDSRGLGGYAHRWDTKEKALKFLEMRSQNQESIHKTISYFSLSSHTRILDIGAGPGTLVVPLAKKTGLVTTIEPAKGMIKIIEERIIDESIQNLTILPKKWEEIDIVSDLKSPYDLIIASYSLGMADLTNAITKMQSVCSGEIRIFWMAGENSREQLMKTLWPIVHKRPFLPPQNADIFFQVLYEMNIYSNIRVTQKNHNRSYATIHDVVIETKRQLNCTDEFDKEIEELLRTKLKEENGVYTNSWMYTSMEFSWKMKDRNA